MGSNCCKNNTVQSTQLPQRNKQIQFFEQFPRIKSTIDHLYLKKQIPLNWVINRNLETVIPNQGVFLGKKNVKVRSGYGVMLYKTGFYYIGCWNNHSRQGLGIMVDNNNNYYKGEWYLDEPNGYGQYYDLSSNWIYRGKWKNGMKDGKGEQTFPNQVKYVGNYRDDKKDGPGKLIFKDNCYFEGVFVNDVINGTGKERGLDFEYIGPWVNNQMQGPGRCIYFLDGGKQDQFIGQYDSSQKHGYGEYRWANGDIYKGMWQRGRILNQGVFIIGKS